LASKTQTSTVDIHSNIVRLSEVTQSTVLAMERSNEAAQLGIVQVREVSSSLEARTSKFDELDTVNASVASPTEQKKPVVKTLIAALFM
jgi:methyl-accepting chemotaxis protein